MNNSNTLKHVIKRDGKKEELKFDKITSRIQKLCYEPISNKIDQLEIVQKVIAGIYPNITTTEIDNLAAETAANYTSSHPDYGILAGRIEVSNLHKNTKKSFSDNIEQLYNYINPQTDKHSPLISKEVYEIIKKNKNKLDSCIIYDRDFLFDYFGIKTLEKSYLIKMNNIVKERPQQMYLRVAIGIWKEDIPKVIETYNFMSQQYFIHATPTLYNSGTCRPQLSSCFLLTMKDDSIDGIYDTLKDTALISKYAGGIGLSIHNIRAKNSFIEGTNGHSNGIVPLLRVFNNTARYVDQGGGKRKGSFAIYLEPWHKDIIEFLDLKKTTGDENSRAIDLFYALWIPDLFMERVQNNEDWTLFCPNEAPGLNKVHSEEFNKLYLYYEEKFSNTSKSITMKAQELWSHICTSQIETGTPYILYKDHCNNKSNQQNLGTIQSSNLCAEIVEYTAPDEIAVCNLASINLQKFITDDLKYDFNELHKIAKIITRNLNKVIDVNYYPVQEATHSNLKHRPIGIGVQALADTFIRMRYPFDSVEAQELNKLIFETIYHGAMEMSIELAKEEGVYESYENSPLSKGQLQYDLWNITPSNLWDWKLLRTNLKQYGARNSLLVAIMPTASTAQILGNNESIEPYTSNIYTRRVLSGEFVIINKHLIKDLIKLNVWNNDMKNQLIANKGSIQHISGIPSLIKSIYKTVWEIKQKVIVDLAADRGPYICQSQSMNIHLENPNIGQLTSCHFHSWKKGLKTGCYYLRSRPKTDAKQFTVDKSLLLLNKTSDTESCSIECDSCGA